MGRGILIAFCFLLSLDVFAVRGKLWEKNVPSSLTDGVVTIMKKRKDDHWSVSCSGTIIAYNLVLTAAHCFEDDNFSIEVVHKNRIYQATEVGIHENYTYKEIFDDYWTNVLIGIVITNDLAYIKVKGGFPRENVVSLTRISIPFTKNKMFALSGYGQVANIFGMGEGEGLLRTSVKILATEYSENRLRIQSNETGGCQGDSGGPLWGQVANNNWSLVGVTSQGDCNTFTWFERISLEKWENSVFQVTKLPWVDMGPVTGSQVVN